MKGKRVKTIMRHRASPYIVAAAAALSAMLPLSSGWAGIGGSDFASASTSSSADLSAVLQSDLMLVGSVDSVDYGSLSLQALGQVVRVANQKEAKTVFRSIRPGYLIEVRGRIVGPGEIQATSISLISKYYVAGAQNVLVHGLVTSVKPAIGRLKIGKLLVDYTGALYDLDPASITVGSVFVALGIQPLAQGALVAVSGIGGSDTRGIGGSDVKGIGGSDVKGIGGSDVKGIGGSDVKGIGGSDVKGIGGSDVKGIGGSDVKGIGGSDVKGIGGSDVKGIGGSDVKGIGGSDVKGIGGSDVKGIGGSDVKGIGGSDLRGIGGSDTL